MKNILSEEINHHEQKSIESKKKKKKKKKNKKPLYIKLTKTTGL